MQLATVTRKAKIKTNERMAVAGDVSQEVVNAVLGIYASIYIYIYTRRRKMFYSAMNT